MTWFEITVVGITYIVYFVIPCINSALASKANKTNSSMEFTYHYHFQGTKRKALFITTFLFAWLMQAVEIGILLKTISGIEVADREALNKIFKDGEK